MALCTAFEAVKENKQRRIGRAVEMIDIDEIAIRRFPAFAAQFERARLDQQRPDGLRMAAGQPGWGNVRFQCKVCG
jgi:hypothetical protein